MDDLCETCLERGRKRPGKDRGRAGILCDPCFQGNGEKAERRGENFRRIDDKKFRAELRRMGRDLKRKPRRRRPDSGGERI
jgi:hypothetical protein